MSDLTIKGNIVSDLGAYLPTPYIQEVQVHEQRLTIKCSLYLNFLDKSEDEISDIIADLQDLQVYVFYALGPEYSQRIIDKKVPNIFKELTIGRTDAGNDINRDPGTTAADSGLTVRQSSTWSSGLGSYAIADWDQYSPTGYQYFLAMYTRTFDASNFKQIVFSNFTRGDTALRDEADNQIIEFSTTFEIPVYAEKYSQPQRATDDNPTNIYGLSENSSQYLFNTIDDSLTGLTVFAFSSFLDYNAAGESWTVDPATSAYSVGGNSSADNPTSWAHTTVSDPVRKFNAIYPVLPNRLATKQISNIAYENIFKDNTLNREPQILYVMQGGANYHDTPIQIGSGTYYTQDGITLEEITAKFQELVNENQDTKHENLKNIVDNMSLILETYGESHNLLVKLGNLGRAFTSKTTATAVGKLYQRYKKRFSAVNAAAERGTVVTKKLQRNLKIRDLRGLTETSPAPYTTPIEGTDWFQPADPATPPNHANFSGFSSPDLGILGADTGANPKGSIIYTPKDFSIPTQTAVDVYMNELNAANTRNFEFNLEYGYFFVDQEKAIRYWSNIARLFDVTKIEHWFSKKITNLAFKFDWANIIRRTGEQSTSNWYNGKTKLVVETYFDYTTGSPIPSLEGAFAREHDKTTGYALDSKITAENNPPHDEGDRKLSTLLADLGKGPAATSTGGGAPPPSNAWTYWDGVYSWHESIGKGTPAIFSAGATEYANFLDPGAKSAHCQTGNDGTDNCFYSYIMPRNITTVFSKGHNIYNSDLDYRVMCFEYQFVAGEKKTAHDHHAWKPSINYPGVGFIDNTLDIFREMVLKLEEECINTTSPWQEYLALANEPCNFNSATGQFNDFFKDSIKTYFEGVSPPPWIRVPLLYYMHLDILHNRFGGDKAAVTAAAKTASDQINPKTGNITAAQDFDLLVQALYDDYYASLGQVREIYRTVNGSDRLDLSYESKQVEFGGSTRGYYTNADFIVADQAGWTHAWLGFPGLPENINAGAHRVESIRAFIWNSSQWQIDLENVAGRDISPDDPGIGMELGRSAIIT